MSFLQRKAESRAISYQDVWSRGGSVSNLNASSYSVALSLIPVYAATGLIADALAASPWAVFDDAGGVPAKAPAQPGLVVSPGANGLDTYSWKHQMVTSMLLWGNAYGLILDVDPRGVPSKVQWLRPDRMSVDENRASPVYRYNGVVVDRSLLVHIPLYVVPGSVVGVSPIGQFRTQIETGLEAQRVGKDFFKRGSIPSGVLRNKEKVLTAEVAQTAQERFLASVSASKPFVTGADWDYTSIGLPASDVAFLAGLKYSATQVAAIYRVAPEDIGGETSGSSLTYKNLEQDQIRFNIRTLRPIAARVEAVFNPYFPPSQYSRFNLDAGVRADIETRFKAHAIAIQNRFELVDEVRALEERPPLTDAQIAKNESAHPPAPAAQA